MSRIVSRAAALLVIVAGAITCSESPTSINRSSIRLALAPQFTPQAAAIYSSLSSFAVTLDNVHVVVRGTVGGDGVGSVLADTTIDFPANASEVTIDIDLTIDTQEQGVVASIELRQGTTAYFGGTQSFVARQGVTTTSPQPIELTYVGPGAAATILIITPSAPTLAPSANFQFTALVQDNAEHAVTDLPLSWSTSDATIATVSPNGLVTSTAKAGSATLTVTGLNGISQQTTIRVQPVATLVVQRGADQIATAGSTLTTPFQVQALDANQAPVIGAPINFAAVNGAGSVSPSTATTDANGFASTVVTLGSAIGGYTFTAQAAGNAAQTRIVATANAAAAASLSIASGNQQADTVMATLGQPLTVRVSDGFGNPVANQVVDFKVSSGQAALLTPGSAGPAPEVQVATGTDGTANVSLVGGAVAGSVKIAASLPGTSVVGTTFEETLKPGVASRLAMVQQPSPTAQATIPLGRQPKVQVTDLYGNPVALAGLLINASATVDCGSGAVCARVVAPRPTGAQLDRAPASGAVRHSIAPTRQRRLTRSLPGTARLTVPATFSATRSVSDTFPQGLGGTTQVVTDANGVASFTDLALDLTVGPWLLQFFDSNESLAVATSSDIALSPGPITSIVAQGGADTLYFATTSDTLHPAAVVIDAVGNGIPGVTVTWTIPNGNSKLDSLTTTTDASGVASPGNWLLLPIAGAVNSFEILATPSSGSKVENSPLPIVAIQLLQ